MAKGLERPFSTFVVDGLTRGRFLTYNIRPSDANGAIHARGWDGTFSTRAVCIT